MRSIDCQGLILLFFLVLPAALLAQADPGDFPVRVEIPAQSVNETYRTIPMGSQGLLVFYRSNEADTSGRVRWYFIYYDKNLQQKWMNGVPIPGDHVFHSSFSTYDTLALLFVPGGKNRSSDQGFEILRVVAERSKIILNNGNTRYRSEIDGFCIHGDRVWLALNNSDQGGKIFTSDLSGGFGRLVSPGTGSSLAIDYIDKGNSTSLVKAVVSREISRHVREYFLVDYDTAGTIVSEVRFGIPDEDKVLGNFSLTVKEDSILILGTYGEGKVKSEATGKGTSLTVTGLFSVMINGGKAFNYNQYNFLEFDKAAQLLGEKEIMELKKKALKKSKQLSEYSVDFQILPKKPWWTDNELIISADIYSPQYHSETFTDFDFYGRPYTNSYSVFDGYRFTHTVIVGFKIDGEKIWDNAMQVRNLLSMELSPVTAVFQSGRKIVMAYYNEGKVGSQILNGPLISLTPEHSIIELLRPEERLNMESKVKLSHWYEDYLIIYGYQEIKNFSEPQGNKRLVYSVTKVRFEP